MHEPHIGLMCSNYACEDCTEESCSCACHVFPPYKLARRSSVHPSGSWLALAIFSAVVFVSLAAMVIFLWRCTHHGL